MFRIAAEQSLYEWYCRFKISGLMRLMRNPFIQITRHLYEEPYQLNLVILASNGLASGGLEFYSNTTHLEKLGQALSDFPSHDRANHLFELGSERSEDNFGYYFRLRAHGKKKLAYGDNRRTRCYIQLRLNNNASAKDHFIEAPQLTDFNIEADFESVRNLGSLLVGFAKLEHQRLSWSPSEGFLDNELEFSDRRDGDNIEAALASLPILK